MNQQISLEIPPAHVEEEEIPLLEPTENMSKELQALFAQIPHELKINGFGYFMKQVENEMDLLDYEFYASYLANYYSFNCSKEVCSFADWVDRVQSKVGGYRYGVDVNDILESVKHGNLSIIDGARHLFTRNQMVYYGW